MTSLPTLLTTGEVAEALSVGPDTVRRWAETGQLPAIKLPSGVRRFRREDVERILQGGQPVADQVADTGAAHPLLLVAVVLVAWVAAFNTPPGTLLVGLIGVCGAVVLAGFAWAAGVRALAERAVAARGRRD